MMGTLSPLCVRGVGAILRPRGGSSLISHKTPENCLKGDVERGESEKQTGILGRGEKEECQSHGGVRLRNKDEALNGKSLVPTFQGVMSNTHQVSRTRWSFFRKGLKM